MKTTDYFIKYDHRRSKWQVKPMGWVALFLALILLGGAGLGVWRGMTQKVTPVSAQATFPTPTPAPVSRPAEWPVWEAQVINGHPSYDAPQEIKDLIVHDFEEAQAVWKENALKPDALLQIAPQYFSGKELTMRLNVAHGTQEAGIVGVSYNEEALIGGKVPVGVMFQSIDATGKTAYVTQYVGQRQVAFYQVADGNLVEGSEQTLPPMSFTYKLVFDPAARRWKIDQKIMAVNADTGQIIETIKR